MAELTPVRMALLGVALLSIVACGSAESASSKDPVACGADTVMCNQSGDDDCCPQARPFFCSAPPNPGDIGCYPTQSDADAVCGTVTFNGQTQSLAYRCQ